MSIYPSQTKLFKALMHPARLEILSELRQGEHCVCHLEAVLGYRQAYISQHLSVLKEAGIVEDRRDGWNIYYRVSDPQVFVLLDTALEIAGESGQEKEQSRPEEVAACPCPQCSPADIAAK